METEEVEQTCISTDQEEIANVLGRIYFSVQTNPLLIDTVLMSLLQFLDYETLKRSRLVCHKWKEIGDSMFIEHSTFSLFNTTTKIPESFLESSKDISTLFKSINQEDYPVCFSAYKFQLIQLTPPVKEIYFKPYRMTMTQLEISYERDMAAGLSGFQNADHFLGPNLVKLKLTSQSDPWQVTLEKLSSIPKVYLTKCKIIISPGVKIAPNELKLDHCSLRFEQDNPYLYDNDSPITHFIDFRSLEKLELTYPKVHYNNATRSSLILNWSDCVNVKSLRLGIVNINLDDPISPKELILEGNRYRINGNWVKRIVLTDYLTSGSHMNKLKLNDSTERFDFLTVLSIDELEMHIEDFYYFLDKEAVATVLTNVKKMSLNLVLICCVDISLLPIPTAVEILELADDGNPEFELYSTESVYFPKLKRLTLRRQCASRLQDFKNCPELAHVTLDNDGELFETFNVEHLPPNIKSLSFNNNFGAEVVGTKKLEINLQLLVLLIGYSELSHDSAANLDQVISFFKEMLNKLRKIDLVVFHRIATEWPFDEDDISKIMTIQQELGQCNISFGPVNWKGEDVFQNSILYPLVDKKSEYYIFEGEKGKGISKFEFSKLISSSLPT